MSSIFGMITHDIARQKFLHRYTIPLLLFILFVICGSLFPSGAAYGSDLPLMESTDGHFIQPNVEDLRPLLQEIPLKTHRRGILEEETDIYFQALGYIQQLPTVDVKRAARQFLQQRRAESEQYQEISLDQFPVFVDLYKHPEIYQGKPVTMSGHIQRSVVSVADRNPHGIKNLCEAWLFTPDAQANPTVVIATEFPPDFPIGEQTVDRVTVTGYIYRLYTYDARDAGRFAPLLMARQIDWKPVEKSETASSAGTSLLILFVFIVLLAFLLAKTWNSRVPAQPRRRNQRVLPTEIVLNPDTRHEIHRPQTLEKPAS